MPRTHRHMPPNTYHHVMMRGNNKHQIFHCFNDYRQYLSLLHKYKSKHPCEIYHYCLMPNHIHLLVKVYNQTEFSAFIQQLSLAYTQYYQQHYEWVGYFWQSRFKNKCIADEGHFLQCGKYIEMNPVRAQIVQHPAYYEYSSYNFYAYGKESNILTINPHYTSLNREPYRRRREYEQIVVPKVSGWDLSPLSPTEDTSPY